MKYRPDKNDVMISQLGYGCMRFTRKGTNVDYEKAEKEVMRAIEAGVNYFDTAYLYPGSEAFLGELMQKHQCREKIPGNFYYYNLMYLEKKNVARVEFAQNMALQKEPGFASQCVGCGKCETKCPQNIEIRKELKKADSHLRPPHFKAAIGVVRAIKKRI